MAAETEPLPELNRANKCGAASVAHGARVVGHFFALAAAPRLALRARPQPGSRANLALVQVWPVGPNVKWPTSLANRTATNYLWAAVG